MLVRLIKINPVSSCNLSCVYCYAGSYFLKKRKIRVMERKTLNKIAEIIENYIKKYDVKDLEILFHGYEPLLAGPDWYSYALEKLKDIGINNFSVQTNGTVINEEYIKLFKEYNVSVGISLDPPKDVHNKLRIFPNGKGTWDIVTKNLEKIINAKVTAGIVTVFTKLHIGREKEILENYYRLGVKGARINPIFLPRDHPLFNIIYPNNYELAESYKKLFILWITNKKYQKIQIDPFYELVRKYFFNEPMSCSFEGSCIFYMSIYWDRRTEVCDSTITYGNVLKEDDLIKFILNSNAFKLLLKRKEYVMKNCSSCEIFEYCHGGCPHETLVYHGTIFAKYPRCEFRKRFIPFILDILKKVKIQMKLEKIGNY